MNYKHLVLGVLTLPLVASCVKDDYDLSDIDTTSRFNVNDLVIPVNIAPVTLGDIITYDENSKIKPITIDGKEFYALTETGRFHSEAIKIASVTAPAPSLNPSESHFDPVSTAGVAASTAAVTVTYEMKPMGNELHYNAGHVDDAIIDLESVQTNMNLTLTLQALNTSAEDISSHFENVVIQAPKGLQATASVGEYVPETGRWTIASLDFAGVSKSISLDVTAIDFRMAGATIDANHRFEYSGEFRVLEGSVTLTTEDVGATMPEALHFCVSYSVTDMEASAFSGIVNYRLEGMDIAPISLSDIPEFLSSPGTNIRLSNPQIYLGVNNPVADNSLDCTSGITLTAERNGMQPLSFSPDVNSFTIGHGAGVTGPYNFVLAPNNDYLTTPGRYASNLTFVKFTSLSDLLAVPAGAVYENSGIPDRIGVTLDNPEIPAQHVTDFALGRDLNGVDGTYEVVAPLALENDAVIIYTTTEDGWNDEDVDALTINKLSLTATVTNECPLGVEMYAWPIDVRGDRIPGVEVRSSHVGANSSNVALEIEMTGVITHLDGVIFEARVEGSDNNTALTPLTVITLKDIRARVSGYYEKEL